MQSDGFHDLMRQAQRGDKPARERLLALVRPLLAGQVEQMLGFGWQSRSSDDLIQDTLLRALAKLDRFHGGADDDETARKFRRWMARVLRSVHSNRERSKKRKRACPPTPLISIGTGAADDSICQQGVGPIAGKDPTPTKDLVVQERRRLIEQALQELNPKGREIVQLRIFECWSFTQIAKYLQCDESTVRYHFHEILKQLAPKLKGLV
jgi:RNA polymerase sigma factor (sigma-70 family)